MIDGRATKTLALAVVLGGVSACSGPTEDVRVSFCKNISSALVGDAASIEWKANDNTFRRPEYAIAALTFDVDEAGGASRTMQTACYFEYDAIEDTAQHLADPFSAYATLPFAMTVDGRMLADAELVRLRNAEQVRQGKAVIAALESGARELAAKVRAGIGQ